MVSKLRAFRITRALGAALSCAALGCDANLVDAVQVPLPEPEPEPEPEPTPEPEPSNPLQATLIHRYSFDGDGTLVIDSKYAAHGEVLGTTLAGDGTLSLIGETSMQHVDLPNHLMRGLSDATFEAWVTWRGGKVWQRVFDFGNSSNGEGAPGSNGTSYLFLTVASGNDPARGLSSALRAAFSTNGVNDEDICHGSSPLPIDQPTHVALVIDHGNQRMILYRDGVLEAECDCDGAIESECDLSRSLSLIDDVNNWLGRSNYAADADFAGSYDEFRIYDAALTAEQIAESFEAGPDAER
jgi:hypothetical protein